VAAMPEQTTNLVKPFVEEEFATRLRTLLRCGRLPVHPKISAGDLVIDRGARNATYKNRTIALAATEFRILEYLAVNVNLALSRQQILERVWGDAFDGGSNIVDVYVCALRRKLGAAGARKRIVTVWGVGYKLIG
jgi:DNA-binding response OmpR family regulator